MAAKWPCVRVETKEQCVELASLAAVRGWALRPGPPRAPTVPDLTRLMSQRRYLYAYLTEHKDLWLLSISEPYAQPIGPLILLNSISALHRYTARHFP
jgi:hypothetical protein